MTWGAVCVFGGLQKLLGEVKNVDEGRKLKKYKRKKGG